MRVRGFARGRTPRRLDDLALRGDSVGDYRNFWDASAQTDAENAVAFGLDDIWESGKSEAAILTPYFDTNAVVLEVGCGIGRILFHVAPLCLELHGIDISQEMVRKADANLRERENVRLHVGTGYDLPFPDMAFDFAYSCRVFQHIPKNIALNYLKEVYRVLKPGGRFVLQVPNILLDEHMLSLNHFAQQQYFENPYPMYFYTPAEVERVGAFVGFEVEVVDDWLLAVLTKPDSGNVGVSVS